MIENAFEGYDKVLVVPDRLKETDEDGVYVEEKRYGPKSGSIHRKADNELSLSTYHRQNCMYCGETKTRGFFVVTYKKRFFLPFFHKREVHHICSECAEDEGLATVKESEIPPIIGF